MTHWKYKAIGVATCIVYAVAFTGARLVQGVWWTIALSAVGVVFLILTLALWLRPKGL